MSGSDGCPGCEERDAIVAALAARIRDLESQMNPPAGGGFDSPPAPARVGASSPVRMQPPPEPKPATVRFSVAAKPDAGSKGHTTTTIRPIAAVTKLDDDTRKILNKLGFPPEDMADAARAMKDHGNGLTMIAPFAANKIHGAQIFHAAFAAEKFGKESAERAIRLAIAYYLEGPDIFHAADADRNANADCAALACEMGYRKRDILFAAKAFQLWPLLAEGRKALEEMQKLFAAWKVDVHEEDIRYTATTYKNLGPELLEKAMRDRHPKNSRENWLRGASIPLIAWAYRLDGPHTGNAIEEANKRTVRRERIGHHVIAVFAKKRGKEIDLPEWL